jgi:capsular polysaccharide transport system permease protein
MEQQTKQMRKKMPQQLNIKKFLPILVPLFLAVFYYGLIASDKYVTTASFVIRGAETPKVDMVGMLTGLPGQASQSLEDAYILKDYLLSQDMLGDLRKQLPLEEIFRHEDADYFSRMAAAPSIEDLQKYWQKMVDVTIDKSTGLVTLHVRAFTPTDSMKVIESLLQSGEKRLNSISMRSRNDTLKMADSEMAESIKRMNESGEKLSSFRLKHKMIDPTQTAVAQASITTKLEEELVSKMAERASLLTYMQASAPQVITLKKRIDSLRRTLDAENEKNVESLLAQDDPEKARALMDEYNQLVIDREVAEKAYVASTQFLETARLDALSQRRYVMVFSYPRLPEEAAEPLRLRNIAIVLVFSLLLWGIGQMILATVKEHRQWNI